MKMELTEKDIIKFLNYYPRAETIYFKVKSVVSSEPSAVSVIYTKVDEFTCANSEEIVKRLFDLSFTHFIEGVERIPHRFPASEYSKRIYDFTIVESPDGRTNITPDLIECVYGMIKERP